jgi:Flp pilus assembly protein TadD
MRERYESPSQYSWIVYAVAIMLFGGIAGYVMAVQGGGMVGSVATQSATAATAASAGPAVPVVDESELRAYREILARDPKNSQAAVRAGNLLYDAQRYAEAIPLYEQAFALLPTDINVSTDLGTALWYAGRPAEALAQYEKSLAINPSHGQTLFNVGIVRADGTHDYAGAVTAWETLLRANPGYPEAARVATLIADAKQKSGTK